MVIWWENTDLSATMSDQEGLGRYTRDDFDRIAAAHERYLSGDRRGQRAILRFGQARGVDFSRRRLMQCDFTGTNLQGASLTGACFDRASLHFADMRGVAAADASFVCADMRGVSLRGADLTGANLDSADLTEAVLVARGASASYELAAKGGPAVTGGVALSVDFTGSTLKQVRLVGANLQRANFSGVLLNGADLRGVDFAGARMDGAVLTGADLTGAHIDPAALALCLLDPTAAAVAKVPRLLERVQAAELCVRSHGAEGRAGILDGEDLRPLGDALAGRLLTALSARDACGVGVSFAGAQLQAARFDGADLRDADFTDADLRGASFRGAKLRHARFARADLRPLSLIRGDDQPVDLTGADYAPDGFGQSRRG